MADRITVQGQYSDREYSRHGDIWTWWDRPDVMEYEPEEHVVQDPALAAALNKIAVGL